MKYQSKAELESTVHHSWGADTALFSVGRPFDVIEAAEILDEVRRDLERDLDKAEAGVARLAALLKTRASDPSFRHRMKGGLAQWQQHKVLAYIRRRLDKPIFIEELAKVASLSTSHFGRAFKESMGLSPHVYITKMRTQRAQELMRSTGERLAQIAMACGFADQAHLSRHFRRIVGQSPDAWRRLNGVAVEVERSAGILRGAAPRDQSIADRGKQHRGSSQNLNVSSDD